MSELGEPLTKDEQAIVDLARQGRTKEEIAAALGLHKHTIQLRSSDIRAKMGLPVHGSLSAALAPPKPLTPIVLATVRRKRKVLHRECLHVAVPCQECIEFQLRGCVS